MRRLLIALALLILVGQSQARPTGIDSVGDNGCVCHGGSDDTTTVNFVGLPEVYNASQVYQITLSIDSPVEENEPKGGFRLIISQGTISGEAQFLDDGYTHNTSTNNQREWDLLWTAPAEDDKLATFVIHGNAVNGDGETTGDEWNSLSLAVPGPNYTGDVVALEIKDDKSSNLQFIVGAIGITALVTLAYLAIKD